jgi:ABC transport system ATP-binding/permease protein
MALLSFLDLSIGFGGPLLLDRANLQVDRGERVCLVGRNGAGKSTLMKVIAGEIAPDSGQVFLQPGKKVARLKQEVPAGMNGTVREIVLGPDTPGTEHDWERDLRAERLLQEMELPPEATFGELSAGLKRRVLLARGLVEDPALLLLDEPTNHLDIESIAWLENFLLTFSGAILFVTHDRMFLRKLATRILELDRGVLTSWSCDYDSFLERKENLLEAQAKQQAAFDKKLAQEEAWLRQGVKARRTRNEGRVRALKALREERRARREKTGLADLTVQEAAMSGQKVVEAEGICFTYDHQPLIDRFSTLIGRGDKIGIVGPNGTGKSTLLRILLGQLKPTSGSVKLGTKLEIAYFDQLRATLDEEKTVRENIGHGSDTVTVNGRSRHVISYLEDFLFSPDRARSPVKSLSGGERNRLLLARLFTQPANLLVLDEPTNDLDAETLELLEDLLVEYSGTLLLVSHDRAFLNNVVTSLIVFEGGGQLREYVGGYDDYQRQQQQSLASPASPNAPAGRPSTASRTSRPRKFSNRERKELEELPRRIEVLEQEQKKIAEEMTNPGFYQAGGAAVTERQSRLDAIETEMAKAFARWEELETLQNDLETS